MMRIGSLFAGVGGLELGLERAGVGHTVWQVEIDPFCRKVLAKHWPNAERFEDVKTFEGREADVICGGFPCQDLSSAGKRAGLSGAKSGLWYEFARIVSVVRPRFVVVENVNSGKAKWLCSVRADLHSLGYRTRAIQVSAAEVGAPHLRRRIFVVAYADTNGKHAVSGHGQVAVACGDALRHGVTPDTNIQHLRDGERRGGRACRQGQAVAGDAGARGQITDAAQQGLPRAATIPRPSAWAGAAERAWSIDSMPEPAIRRVDDGLSAVVVRRGSIASLRGARSRNLQIKALGNAVVPQCAEVVGRVMMEVCHG